MTDRKKTERLARQLHAQALASRSLKPPRALAALATHGGLRMVARSPQTTWQDYLPDARRLLSQK